MKLWLTSFVLLLGLAEGYQWLKQLLLPMPVLLVAGAVLAVVSNWDRLFVSSLRPALKQPLSGQTTEPLLPIQESLGK